MKAKTWMVDAAGWRLYAGLVVVGCLAAATPVEATHGEPCAGSELPPNPAYNCAAALDVDVHYCNAADFDIGFPSDFCDPFDIQDTDVISITVEISNDSEKQVTCGPPWPPVGPPFRLVTPSGNLVAGTTYQIFYACSASTCLAGQELPNWLTFDSVAWIHPDVSFADNGDGYSGTLTIDTDISYALEDEDGKKLIRFNTIAHAPPAEDGATVYARANGLNPDNFLVTDGQCLPGLTGTGEGSTAGLFGFQNGEFDVCNHPNKQIVKLNKNGDLEYSYTRAAFHPPANYDPLTCDFHFGYENVNGRVSEWHLRNDEVKKTGKCYKLVDSGNKGDGDVQYLRLCPMKDGKWCFNFKGWGDFDANMTHALMPLTLRTPAGTGLPPPVPMGCATSISGPPGAVWNMTPKQWTLPLSVW